METKQTAVEWFFERLWETPKDKLNWYAILEQAKLMEKKQIMEAQVDMYNTLNKYAMGIQYCNHKEVSEKYSQEYYNETYEK